MRELLAQLSDDAKRVLPLVAEWEASETDDDSNDVQVTANEATWNELINLKLVTRDTLYHTTLGAELVHYMANNV